MENLFKNFLHYSLQSAKMNNVMSLRQSKLKKYEEVQSWQNVQFVEKAFSSVIM